MKTSLLIIIVSAIIASSIVFVAIWKNYPKMKCQNKRVELLAD
ncbi:hypothetical protein [Nitrosopumilus adriaticus]